MLIVIDPADSTALYRQIAGQLRRAIGEGRLAKGERLPPVRELAASLDVNLHTVRQAYAELRGEGLVEVRPGRGATVLANGPMARVRVLAEELVEAGRWVGMTRADLARMLEEA